MVDNAALQFVIRMTAGKIGSPAASDDVHPSGRNLFEARSKVDACSAFQPRSVRVSL
jgi:hypothetical protein